MTETLALLFQESKSAVIELNNRLIYAIFKIKLEKPQAFLIRRLKAINPPLQGLRIKADKGIIEVNGQRHPEIILWTDTSPEVVNISVIPKAGCELKMWNVWKVDDVTHAWTGNAGFLITELDDVLKLECSNGIGAIDFSDLVIEIEKILEN